MDIQTYNINVYIPIEMNNKRIPVNVWHRKKKLHSNNPILDFIEKPMQSDIYAHSYYIH